MERVRLSYLQDWLLAESSRKPLIIRGARQVGKTWLVRHLAKINNKTLIEINLEKQPQFANLFTSNNPKSILQNLEVVFNQVIDPNNSLLFIDEIQAAPELLSKLRWFAEELSELPLIAAGSLLEFVLAEHSFSMPVGRISYMYLEPLSFEEFLLANDKAVLYKYLENLNWNTEIPDVIHEQLLALFKEFLIVGGLPAAVLSWVTERSFIQVNKIQHDLLATYRDDFAKYNKRIAQERLHELITAIPGLVGQKFIYSHVNPQVSTKNIKEGLYLLNKAKICHQVMSSAANGVPLGAEVNEKYFKVIFLDVGLASAALGLTLTHINSINEVNLVYKGNIAEQVTGQLLRTLTPAYIEPNLYYWQRGEKGSNAELDYIIQHGHQVVPIEVKAGSTGSLKSLHLFMGLKKYPIAVRINSDLPSKAEVKVKDSLGNRVNYRLLSLPFYLIGQLHRLIETI